MTRARCTSRRTFHYLIRTVALTLWLAGAASAQVPTPEDFFGFRMGTDGRLADWPTIQRYFTVVAQVSDRVELVDLGATTEQHRLIGAIVSAPANIGRLTEIQAANRRLADPRTLDPADAERLAARHTAVVAIGCSIHATEIGGTQAANELLYELATRSDPRTLAVLNDVVLLLFPSLNPDGHTLVVDWHEQTAGTPFEAAPMPWLYHKYVGHDINRDAFMLNMPENRHLSRFFYTEWHPQVFLTLHQMGSTGPRFFVPPNYDPIDPNYDPLIWREAGLLGHAMALELERDNRAGVVSNAMYDYYWPGYEDSAPLGHNTVCLLTEVASARLSYPVVVAPDELSGSPRGLPDYRPQINFPNPWPGGTWRLRDIVDYDLSAVRGLLTAVSRYRQELVQSFYVMGRRAVDAGMRGGPFAFVIPPDQHDPLAAMKLVNLLIQGSVEVRRARAPFRANGFEFPGGSNLVLMAQPFRAYAKTLLERQDYPVRRLSPGGPPERPYDVAGWTLPLQMGVEVIRVEDAFTLPDMTRVERMDLRPAAVHADGQPTHYVIDGAGSAPAIAINRLVAAGLEPSWTLADVQIDDQRLAAGAIVVPHSSQARAMVGRLAAELGLEAFGRGGSLPDRRMRVGTTRIGLYKPWVSNIDEGWTRWLLERYEFPVVTLTNGDVQRGNLDDRFDVIILPDARTEQLVNGHPRGRVPQEFAGGLGDAGTAALRAFVERGGTLVALDSASDFAISTLGLPVRNVTAKLPAEEFFCPGSILALQLDPTQPLAFGMPERTAAFFAYGSAFELTDAEVEVQVVGRYGTDELLLSGWLEGGDRIAGRPAVLDVPVGRGRAVLIGFRAQHRGQSYATFRLLFNAILTSMRS